MYIDVVPNRKSRPAILLRESIREGERIVKRTIANLSALSLEQAEAIRAVLKGGAIRKLLDAGCIQMSLFDERNLFELAHEDFPGEGLVVCRNSQLAALRAARGQTPIHAGGNHD